MEKKFFNLMAAVLAFILASSCSFISSFTETEENVKSIAFNKNSLQIMIGQMETLDLTIISSRGQEKETVQWEFDSEIISGRTDNYGIVFSALKAGTTAIRAKCDGKSVICALRVLEEVYPAKAEDPYVYCSEDIVNLESGSSNYSYRNCRNNLCAFKAS